VADSYAVQMGRYKKATRSKPISARRAIALIGAIVSPLGAAVPAAASTQAWASGGDQPARKHCVQAQEAGARSAGNDDQGPPKFSAAFYKHVFTLDASLDGLEGGALPVSIEQVCGVPKALAKQAAQLAGVDGVALVVQRTTVWEGRTRLLGTQATAALDGADTAILRVRLASPASWRQDEDGNQIPTFTAARIKITD
jgi:hypothetical protein